MKMRSNWKDRRVSFLVSDAHHTIMPVSVTMPVRLKEHTASGAVFEGPIHAVWERRVSPRLNPEGTVYSRAYDLVGVLIASDVALEEGRINWLVQSAIEETEEGAERVLVLA